MLSPVTGALLSVAEGGLLAPCSPDPLMAWSLVLAVMSPWSLLLAVMSPWSLLLATAKACAMTLGAEHGLLSSMVMV